MNGIESSRLVAESWNFKEKEVVFLKDDFGFLHWPGTNSKYTEDQLHYCGWIKMTLEERLEKLEEQVKILQSKTQKLPDPDFIPTKENIENLKSHGVGLLEAKKALQITRDDVAAALEFLRTKGF